jgi:threonine synthase
MKQPPGDGERQRAGGRGSGFVLGLQCIHCQATFPLEPMHEGCPACATDRFRASLSPTYDYRLLAEHVARQGITSDAGIGVWRYRSLLPTATDGAGEISLGEGHTPLVPVPELAGELGLTRLWVKNEAQNPTASFKDRNAAITVAKALEFGATTIIASTSANHGLAVAAYCARADVDCVILTYPGIPDNVRSLMHACGARVIVTEREARLDRLREAVADNGWYPATNMTRLPTNNAYGHEGYKTISYEMFEQLGGEVPDIVAVPTGFGEGIFGIWKGFRELVELKLANRVPRMLACEPLGGPLTLAVDHGDRHLVDVGPRSTIARGIAVTVNTYMGVVAVTRSNGGVASASDPEIVHAQHDLAACGLLAEPASAVGLAGLRTVARRDRLDGAQTAVVIATSSALKSTPTETAAA